MVRDEQLEPIPQRARLSRDGIELARNGTQPESLQYLSGHQSSLLEPCEKISAGGKPLDLRVYRDRDRIQEIESDVGLSGDLVSVAVRTDSGERKIEGSHLLVATGRIANTAGIGLDEAGIAVDPRGFIGVDERLKTTAPGVWVIGECAGSPQFTHVSVDDFRIVRDNMAGGNRKTSDRLVPYVVFTDPPLAHVGLSEGEARRQGISSRVAKLPMRNVLRTEATDETDGFMKVLVGANDDRILGFTMIGPEAGEVMAAIQTAMLAELPYTRLRDAVIAHLTVAEGLGPLFGNVPARSC